MKYLVQLKYTNPSHEHVSLRRRVDTVNRIVEAATEEEAINRIARQQRALGYLIREAKVIESDAKKEKEQLDEEVEQIDEAIRGTIGSLEGIMVRRPADQAERDKLASDITANRKYNKGKKIGRVSGDIRKNAAGMTDAQKLVRTLYDKSGRSNKELGPKKFPYSEEVEQVDEAGDPDKRVAGYKMPAHIKAAQAESDRLSKVEKPVQAGTLAAQRRRQAMKTEAMDPNESKGEKKIVKTTKKAAKAAQKMVNAAKGRMNKINIQPTMDIDVKSK